MAQYFRVRCPNCGEVKNVNDPSVCPKCGAPLNLAGQGVIQLYRMGNFMGSANGFGIYINNQPYGQIGNRESFRIPLPFGKYTLHCVCGMNRKCNDPVIELTPQDPFVCLKVHMKVGFISNSFIFERVDPSTMPQL